MNIPLPNMTFKKCLMMVIALLAVTACKKDAGAAGELLVSGTWRYKMTVTVETPEGMKSGYAVREISNSASSIGLNLPESTNTADVKGEAVVIDLGERGKVFAVMKGKRLGEDYAENILYQTLGGGTNIEGIKALNNLVNKKAVLEISNYPVLVTFTDLNNPKTIKPLLEMEEDQNPDHTGIFVIKADHFEELLGVGVKLKEITIEMTDEPITSKIKSLLPWLLERKGAKGYLGGESIYPYKDPTRTYLQGLHFFKESDK